MYYATQTRAKVKKLKLQLCTLKQEQSISVSLLNIKRLVDMLVVVTSLITNDGHVSHIIHLNHLLHVSHITKNLLNVFKFAKDNNVFFEFHVNHRLMNCQDTKQILLQKLEMDSTFFLLSSTFNPSAYNTTC